MMCVEKKSQKDLNSFEMFFFPPKSQSIKLHTRMTYEVATSISFFKSLALG